MPDPTELLEKVLDDLVMAADLLTELANDLAANGGDDVPNVAYDAYAFVAHLRQEWDL